MTFVLLSSFQVSNSNSLIVLKKKKGCYKITILFKSKLINFLAEASPAPHSLVTRWMGQRRSQRSHFGLELQANRFIHFLKLLLAVSSLPPRSGLAVGAGRLGNRQSQRKQESMPGELYRFEGSFPGA